MQQMLSKKAALIAIAICGMMFVGSAFSDARDLRGPMSTIIAGALIALAIAENNPRE